MGGGSVRITWLKQRALEKLLEAGISRIPGSARKAAGAAGRLQGFPVGALAQGTRGPGEGLLAAAGAPRLGRPWGGGGEAGKRRLFRTFVSRSAALRVAGGRVGGVCCPPENAGLCHPGAGAAVRV